VSGAGAQEDRELRVLNEMKTVPVRVNFKYSINGQPSPYQGPETTLNLPLTKELAETTGTIRWRIHVPIPEAFQRQKAIPVRSIADALPVDLSMDAEDLRSLLTSGGSGSADVELPIRLTFEDGKEVVRDEEGRIQGVVERNFVSVGWDDPSKESEIRDLSCPRTALQQLREVTS
jgi:hypothetical protein